MNTYCNPLNKWRNIVHIGRVLYKLVKKDWVKQMSEKEQLNQVEAVARARLKERGLRRTILPSWCISFKKNIILI